MATATGTQVLEMRDSDEPLAADYSVIGRQDRATLYLALGDAEGDAIRRRVWEREGGRWRHTPYIRAVAATHGLSRSEYEEFRGTLSSWLPASDDPEVVAMAQGRPLGSGGKVKAKRPWISYADMAKLV